MIDINLMLLGRVVKRLRKEINLSQKEFSAMLNIKPSTISRLERAESEVGWMAVLRICQYFEIDLASALEAERETMKKEASALLASLD